MVDQREKLIVIGNGMASQSFCRFMLDGPNGSSHSFEIKVFGEESRPAYDRVHLTDYLSNKNSQSLELVPAHWYAENDIELQTGIRIASINREQKTVVDGGGQEFAYDRLVLATGSAPFVPPIDGVDHPGVFVYRTIEDLESIKQWSKRSKTAAVLGGGLLGLEAARALQDLNLIPHVVEMAPTLMPRQLDRGGSDALREKIERMGVRIHLARRTECIEKHNGLLVLKFDNGERLAVDMIVVSAGIRPRDELARAADLEVGKRGGIIVDDTLQTSDSSIFAVGECVSHRDVIYGLVAPCYQMSRVLASRFCGGKDIFERGDQSAKLKLMGVNVASFGEPIGAAASAQVVSSRNSSGARTLLVRRRKIVGALGVGDWPELERIRAAINGKKRISHRALDRFQSTGRVWAQTPTDDITKWPPEATVCSCLKIKRSELTTACQQGCGTVAQLADETGASTVCGSCRPLLARMFDHVDDAVGEVAGWRGLLIASVTVLIAAITFGLLGPVPFSKSVSNGLHRLDFFWRDDFWKQVSGYSLLSITALSLAFSLRKRVKRFQFGRFGNWRMLHSILGVVTLFGVLVHTGMHLGANLNLMLMVCFLAINFLGAVTGVVTSMESRVTGRQAIVIRQWRPRLTMLHIFCFWPLPLLIAVHVFCVYYY